MRSGYSITVVLTLFVATAAHAQTFEQLSALRFDEPSSSVRSLAMGGATDSVAGDLDAVSANPAAVAELRRPSLSGAATNTSYATELIRGAGNVFFDYRGRVGSTALSHVAVAIPLGGAVVSGYFVERPQLRSDEPLVAGFSGNHPYSPAQCNGPCGYAFALNPGYDIRDRRYGVAVAWRIDRFDIGIGGESRDLDARTATGRQAFLTVGDTDVSDRFFRRTSGRSVVPSAGITWHVVSRVTIGASYKGGGSFDRTTTACGTARFGNTECVTEIATLHRGDQKMPATLRAGVALRITRGLVVTAAAVHRDYTRLAQEPYGILGIPVVLPYRDVTERHAGAEYRFERLPVALRAGWWRDPSRFRQPLYGASDWARHVTHKTYGVGVTFSGTELAFAVDDGGAHGGRSVSAALSRAF